MNYYLWMYQRGGCDYTIACGQKIVSMKSKLLKDAEKEAKSIIRDYGHVNKAVIFSKVKDVTGLITEIKEQEAEARKKRQLESKRKELEALKKELGE